MKTLIAVILGGLALSAMAVAQEPATTQPATTQPDAKGLIAQLGDPDFHMRNQATQALRKMGKDALPLLADARNSPDPEVQRRAEMISKQIEDDANPKPKVAQVQPGQAGGFPGGGMGGGGILIPRRGNIQFRMNAMGIRGSRTTMSVRTDANGTVRDMTSVEDDKTVVIHEDRDGIKMTVTQKKDGKDATDEYKAKDADTLKKEHPDVYPLYEKHMIGMQVKIQNLPGLPHPPVPQP
jgi:hypothetical protein